MKFRITLSDFSGLNTSLVTVANSIIQGMPSLGEAQRETIESTVVAALDDVASTWINPASGAVVLEVDTDLSSITVISRTQLVAEQAAEA